MEVDVGICVGSAVEDVEHRNREGFCGGSTDVAEELEIGVIGCGGSNGKGDAENRICSELALVWRTIKIAQSLVDAFLVRCVMIE